MLSSVVIRLLLLGLSAAVAQSIDELEATTSTDGGKVKANQIPNPNCSFAEEDVRCDCDNIEEDSYKCYNIESAEDLRFALDRLLNATKRYYWSLLEVNCVEPFSAAVKSFHVTEDLFANGPKFRKIHLFGDCSKPKHYDNLIHVDKDVESVWIKRNALRMTTTCSLLQPKLERLFELVIVDSLVAGDMISATFSTRCLGQFGTRNEPLPMTRLTIRSCNITLIESGAFNNLAELQLIDLSHNQLSHLSRQAFAPKMYKVRFIRLENNRLSQLSADFFDGLPQLRSVTLQNNQLVQLPFVPLPGQPQVLFLGNNNWDCRCKMTWIVSGSTAGAVVGVVGQDPSQQRFFDQPTCASPDAVKGWPLMAGLKYVLDTFC